MSSTATLAASTTPALGSSTNSLNTSTSTLPLGAEKLDRVLLLPSLPDYSQPWLKDWALRRPHLSTDHPGGAGSYSSKLSGYQIWAIEQRVTDRNAFLPVIVVYTGNETDVISISCFTPRSTDESLSKACWENVKGLTKSSGSKLSPVFSSTLFIPLTNLPSLNQTTYNILLVKGGDYRTVFHELYENINLRRLGLGGRSALKLGHATSAQQLHFRQLFGLPIASNNATQSATSTSSALVNESSHWTHSSSQSKNSDQKFQEMLLSMIKLVQNALSLFGLGIVVVAGASQIENKQQFDSRGLNSSIAVPSEIDFGKINIGGQNGKQAHAHFKEGDGLLCDSTVAALLHFRIEILEPLMYSTFSSHFDGAGGGLLGGVVDVDGNSSVLSPALLAGLLSLVIGANGKLAALGYDDVPKDPFERRAKFLRMIEQFQKANRISSPGHPNLTRTFLTELSSIHSKARSRHADSSTAKVSRALRTRIDASLSLVQGNEHGQHSGNGSHPNAPLSKVLDSLPKIKGKSDDCETTNLNKLVEDTFMRGLGGNTVLQLWDVRSNRRESRRKERKRSKREIDEEERDTEGYTTEGGPIRTTNGTQSEGDTSTATGVGSGFGRGVLRSVKGVRDRAGRAGKLLGDNFGLTETTQAPHSSPPSTTVNVQHTPAVIISGDPDSSQPMSRRMSLEGEREKELGLKSSSPSGFASRLASALTSSTDRVSQKDASHRTLKIPSPPRNKSRSISPGSSKSVSPLLSGLALGPSHKQGSVRRIVSEAPPATAPPSKTGFEDTERDTTAEDDKTRSISGNRTGRPAFHDRRHSFNVLKDSPEPMHWLSRKRLELDVNLRTTSFALKQRESKLLEMIETLKVVQKSYLDAFASIQEPLRQRTERLANLTKQAQDILFQADSYASSSTSPVVELSTGSSRLVYAQSVLEDKLSDVLDFQALAKSKVCQEGSLDIGMKEMENERRGMRNLVLVLDRWRMWLAFLSSRAGWHLRWFRLFSWTLNTGDMKEDCENIHKKKEE